MPLIFGNSHVATLIVWAARPSFKGSTWTRKVCTTKAFRAVFERLWAIILHTFWGPGIALVF